jgi:hypothetical protein
MTDPTEALRRERLVEINSDQPITRESLEQKYGQVWTTEEMSRDFVVVGFMAPLVVVRRKADNVVGSLEFSHTPRFYFSWQPHEK